MICLEGSVIAPKRKRNHKAVRNKSQDEYIETEGCATYQPGEVTLTYDTDWECNDRMDAFMRGCKALQGMGLQAEDIIDFSVIESAEINAEGKVCCSYELRLVVDLDVANGLADTYEV